MTVLLDTNILIDRENPNQPQLAVNRLLLAIDKFGYEKFIHPASIEELNNYKDQKQRDILISKLASYQHIQVRPKLSTEFLLKLSGFATSGQNNIIDNELLFQIYDQRLNYLITEDRVMYKKAESLGIADKVFSIERFLQLYNQSFPDLVDYQVLAIKKTQFGEHNLSNPFFDSFREDYAGFDNWFKKKTNETAYTFSDELGLSAFLYLKDEGKTHDYSNINPIFKPAKRLKIGTFKVVQSGFRIGERFLKIIFDNAIKRNCDEIYVTIFEKRSELLKLKQMFFDWGFVEHGINTDTGEKILVKKLNIYDDNKSPMQNFPNIDKTRTKRFLPIYPEFHTSLFPDSILKTETEEEYDDKKAYQYALKKVYISWASTKGSKSGDILLIYRTGGSYKGVVSTLCIIDEIILPRTKEELLHHCQNRSIFTTEQLEKFWKDNSSRIVIYKLLYYKSLTNRLIINKLWEYNVIEAPNGPRPLDMLTEDAFNKILELSNTML